MNKGELVAKLAGKTGLSKKDAEASVNSFVEIVTAALKGGESVQLVGFGSFVAKERKAREARNPRTGEKVKIPKTVVPAFKPGKALKDALK